eukprot:6656470-Pyramimonas_sp.AAC.1
MYVPGLLQPSRPGCPGLLGLRGENGLASVGSTGEARHFWFGDRRKPRPVRAGSGDVGSGALIFAARGGG